MSSANDSKPDSYRINAKICRLVERYPCMYDRSHPHYLKKDVLEESWKKIAKKMEDSISSCKERWRNIRTSFARSINVTKVPYTANRTKPYYLHTELQFLARHITPGIPVPRRSNEVTEMSGVEDSIDDLATTMMDAEDSQGEQSKVDGDSCGANGSIKSEQNLSLLEEEGQQCEEKKPSATVPGPTSYPPKKRQRLLDHELPTLLADREPESTINIPASTEDIDFDASFLMGLLPEMKAMNFKQKVEFKSRICDVLLEIFNKKRNTNTIVAPNESGAIKSNYNTASRVTKSTSMPSTTNPGAPTTSLLPSRQRPKLLPPSHPRCSSRRNLR